MSWRGTFRIKSSRPRPSTRPGASDLDGGTPRREHACSRPSAVCFPQSHVTDNWLQSSPLVRNPACVPELLYVSRGRDWEMLTWRVLFRLRQVLGRLLKLEFAPGHSLPRA